MKTNWIPPRTILDLVHEQIHSNALQLADELLQSDSVKKTPIAQTVRCCALAKVTTWLIIFYRIYFHNIIYIYINYVNKYIENQKGYGTWRIKNDHCVMCEQ